LGRLSVDQKFVYNPKAIAKIEAEFKALKTTPKNKKLIKLYVDIVKNRLNLPASAVKACVWEAIRRWQEVHGEQVTKYQGGPLPDRLKVMLELTMELLEVLREFLVDPNQRKKLQETLTKAFEEYRKKFA
jgi:hypothetical protein